MKNKSISTNLIIAILILIIAISSCTGIYAWAKYTSQIDGTATAQVAKWSFKVVDGITETTDVIDFAFTRTDGYGKVAEGVLAPGTYGEFEIGIDASGTETILEYTIDVILNNKPKNLKLYSDSAKTEEITVSNNEFTINGYMDLEEVKTIKTVKVYWNWPYESGDDAQDTQDAGKTVNMQISVTGTEILELPAREMSFSIDGVEYTALEGMTWEQWLASAYNTGNFKKGYSDASEDLVFNSNSTYYIAEDITAEIIKGTEYQLRKINWPL